MIPPFSKPFSAPFVKPFGPEAVGEFSPLDIPGLEAWYDASDESSILLGGGDNVFEWLDKSGNGNDVTSANASEQPLTNQQTINGLNVIEFDGNNDNLLKSSFPMQTAFTLIMVFKVTAAAVNIADSILSMNAMGSPNKDWQMDANDVTGNYFALFDSNMATAGLQSPVDLVGVTTSLMYKLENNGNGTLYNNNSPVASISTYTADINPSQLMRIGINRGNSQSMAHLWAELIIVNEAISDANRNSVFNYFNAKWGV